MVDKKTIYDELNLKQVQMLAGFGHSETFMAKFFEMSLGTWYRYKMEVPAFREALLEWKASADENVKKALYQRAVGYDHTDTKMFSYDGEIISQDYVKHIPPDVNAAKTWLACRDPENWRETQKVEHDHGDLASQILKARERKSTPANDKDLFE